MEEKDSQEKGRPSLFKALLELPAFRELEEVELTEEEQRKIEEDAKRMLLDYLLNLPVFKESKGK